MSHDTILQHDEVGTASYAGMHACMYVCHVCVCVCMYVCVCTQCSKSLACWLCIIRCSSARALVVASRCSWCMPCQACQALDCSDLRTWAEVKSSAAFSSRASDAMACMGRDEFMQA